MTNLSSAQQKLDQQYMQRAIELAKRGMYTTSPNPVVGCVLVKNGEIIGEGWHQKAGEGHAEVNAIANATAAVSGATAYVTLEPCSHFGRTPPCAKGLIDVDVARVVIAMQDPNPLVSGNGISMLNQAGIDTTVGILEQSALALNPGFIKRMQTGKPLLTCKMASSIDGATAMSNGESKWITGAPARQDVQRFRALSCGIISGADTVLIDDAKLNVRYQELPQHDLLPDEQKLRQPIRIIIDSQNRLTADLALFSIASKIILVRTQATADQNWPEFVEELIVAKQQGKADLTDLITKLGQRGLNNLWLESGSTLSGAFIAAQLVDQIILYQAPKIMGNNTMGLFDIPQLNHLKDAISLNFDDVQMVGDDLRICASINTNTDTE